MMKIAVATNGSKVAEHFGRCPEYTIIVAKGEEIESKTVTPNPGHEPGFLPRYLAQMGVQCIIAGGMGPRAQELFAEQNIEIVTGVNGLVDKVVADYLAKTLEVGTDMCHHGQEEHRNCR